MKREWEGDGKGEEGSALFGELRREIAILPKEKER